VLVRGCADDGKDLVISRDYISRGLRARAAERVTLELGPRNDLEIKSSLEKEVEAERWTGIDRALRAQLTKERVVADLRPGTPCEDPELRRLMIGRAAKLERLGSPSKPPRLLDPQAGPRANTPRSLYPRDIIKTMHRAMTASAANRTSRLRFTRRSVDGSGARSIGGARSARRAEGIAYAIVDGLMPDPSSPLQRPRDDGRRQAGSHCRSFVHMTMPKVARVVACRPI